MSDEINSDGETTVLVRCEGEECDEVGVKATATAKRK